VLARRGLELASRETDFLRQQFARQRATFLRLMVVPFGLVAGAVALYLLLSRFVLPRFYQRDALFVARRVGAYLTVLAVIVVIAVYFLEDLKSVAAVLGIAGAAVIIALGDLCSSFAGWFVISASRKVRVGDRVEIDGHRGDVVDIQLLRTTLLELNSWLGVDEPTGRVLVIPNSFIFKSPVLNYSTVHPFVWGKLDITVTYETPAADAEALLMRVLTEETKEEFAAAGRGKDLLEKHYGADHRQYFEPRIHSVIADSGITYSLFYMCHLRKVSATRDRLNRRIIQAFQADPRLQFAYPTLRELRSTLDPNAPTAIWEAPPPGPAPRSG
jgi:small-conductance mechanosensitive channel